jgi:hypothetical protein
MVLKMLIDSRGFIQTTVCAQSPLDNSVLVDSVFTVIRSIRQRS